MIREITKQELQDIYNNYTTAEACKLLGISLTTYYRLLKEAGINKNKRKVLRRKYIIV
jgi:excisionase family DNA binding protein